MKYITFKTIADAGNLCSQMQQYASLYSIAKQTGREIIFPESSINMGYGFKFANALNIPINVAPNEYFHDFIDVRPNDRVEVDYDLIKNLDPTKNYNIVNRFDLFTYWHPRYSQDVLDWTWNEEYTRKAYSLLEKIQADGKQLVAIHVRRGDYLLPQHHHFAQLDTTYYEAALQDFIVDIEKYHFVVFSNDIHWCKDNLIEGDMVTFIEPDSDYVDLILMSMCDHFIIANSSYSWWAAYKSNSKNKKVYCPKNYLREYSDWAPIINGKYYPAEWIAINN